MLGAFSLITKLEYYSAAASTTGILPILACQIFGAIAWIDVPLTSTATDTGISSTLNL